jgi:hypothetical protein
MYDYFLGKGNSDNFVWVKHIIKIVNMQMQCSGICLSINSLIFVLHSRESHDGDECYGVHELSAFEFQSQHCVLTKS